MTNDDHSLIELSIDVIEEKHKKIIAQQFWSGNNISFKISITNNGNKEEYIIDENSLRYLLVKPKKKMY